MWFGAKIIAEGSGAVSAQSICQQHHRGRCSAIAQYLVYQWQGVLREFPGARHDARRYRRQVLIENLLVGRECEHGVCGASVNDERGLLVRSQRQQVSDFLLGSPQSTGLHIALLHG